MALARVRARDVWISPWVQGISEDVRFACRLLLKDRRVTLVAGIALALGIASTNTIFTLVNAMVWRGLPVERPDRVVAFKTIDDAPISASLREIEDWRAATTTFAGPPLAIGLVTGLGGAFGAGWLVRSLLVDTGAADPVMFVSIAMVFVLVASAACFIPARRATRLDPVTALRHE